MSDLISRQAVIDAPVRMVSEGIEWIPVYHVEQLPSAQPETHEKRTETHARDLIDRQAAIDALGDMVMNWTDSDYELGQLNQWKEDRKAIIDLPSAQPQLDTCPIYGGMCGYPSNLCYECPRHEGAKEQPQWWTEGLQPFAQPQRMKGKWERHYSRPNVFADLYWHCSICGYKNSENWANIYHRYCPNCGSEMLLGSHEEVSYSPSSGADMRGEEDAAD